MMNKLSVAVVIAAFVFGTPITHAQSKGPATGLPLPRFVSLKSKRVNMRVGPGTEYAVQWLYTKPGLPMEIIQEFDRWRQIRDSQGTEGWVFHSLLSGKRTAIVMPLDGNADPNDQDRYAEMHSKASPNSPLVAKLQPGVIVKITSCDGEWCLAEADETTGHIEQSRLWGAYPEEKFER